MGYEPKYRLNKKDDTRWHLLLTRHCLECDPRPNRKYPPLTPTENAEFEALCAKRSRKIESHPRVRASIEACNRANRTADRLLKKLENLVGKLRITTK